MGKVIFNMSVSLDGFVAGPNDEVDRVFSWFSQGDTDFAFPEWEGYPVKISKASAQLLNEYVGTTGALLTGRHTFDVSKAWGGKPPMGLSTVVLTHNPPKEWIKEGSPFTFVTEGVERAVEKAREIAGEKNVVISGAKVFQQCLQAGLVDEFILDQAAVLLGRGVRLFDGDQNKGVEITLARVVQGTGVVHLAYSVKKS